MLCLFLPSFLKALPTISYLCTFSSALGCFANAEVRISWTMKWTATLFPPGTHLPTIPCILFLSTTDPNLLAKHVNVCVANFSKSSLCICYSVFCPTFIFDGNLANSSSFPRYNSFSMWPLKLFENSIQLHRIQNWLKSWRPGRVGEIHIYIIGEQLLFQTDKQDKFPKMCIHLMNSEFLISLQK